MPQTAYLQVEQLLATHSRTVWATARVVVSCALSLLRTRIGIVTLLVAREADDSRISETIFRVLSLDALQLLLRDSFFLTIGGLMAMGSTLIANDLLVHMVLVTVVVPHMIPRHVMSSNELMQLAIHPVLFSGKIGEGFQRQILRSNKALDMHKLTIRSLWTETKSVILAHFRWL